DQPPSIRRVVIIARGAWASKAPWVSRFRAWVVAVRRGDGDRPEPIFRWGTDDTTGHWAVLDPRAIDVCRKAGRGFVVSPRSGETGTRQAEILPRFTREKGWQRLRE
ncbi:MAG: hypothetical protein AMXMBFR83_20210, partial [Phycisphaerae bacterium]